MLEADGWYLARTRGSHRHFKHAQKRGIVTIAGHPNVDVPRGATVTLQRRVDEVWKSSDGSRSQALAPPRMPDEFCEWRTG